ncbi:ribonuclease H, partial [Gigaspora rosea]
KKKKEALNTNNKIVIYTDGCLKDNEKGKYAGIGIIYEDDSKQIFESLPGNFNSNSRIELYAAIRAIETCENQEKLIEIRTDSRYVVNSCELWLNIWKKRNWKTFRNEPVRNRDFLKRIDSLIEKRPGKVYFSYVKGHSTDKNNIIADRLAKKGAA